MSVKIMKVRNGVETEAEMVALPIRWEALHDFEGNDEVIVGWVMFIPQLVDGEEIGGISVDIEVDTYGVLKAPHWGPPQQFDSVREAKQYAEATWALYEASHGA